MYAGYLAILGKGLNSSRIYLINNLSKYQQKNRLFTQSTQQVSNLPQAMQVGMSSIGTAKVLVLNVQFNDMKFDSNSSIDSIKQNFLAQKLETYQIIHMKAFRPITNDLHMGN